MLSVSSATTRTFLPSGSVALSSMSGAATPGFAGTVAGIVVSCFAASSVFIARRTC